MHDSNFTSNHRSVKIVLDVAEICAIVFEKEETRRGLFVTKIKH